MTRHDAVTGVVVGVAMGHLAATAAAAPDEWPWIWIVGAAAAPALVLLAPAAERWVRVRVVLRPGLRLAVPAALVVVGVATAFASGQIAAWRVVVWPVAIALAIVAVGREGAADHNGWRLLAGAVALGLAAGAWDRALKIAVPGGTRLGFTFLTAVALALFLYRCVRPLRSLDVRPALGPRELGWAMAALAAAALVALPVGLATGFIEWNPKWSGLGHAGAKLFGLVIFVGLPEELLFRGLIQEGLTRLSSPRLGWIAGSLLFGLSHITKPTGLPPAPETLRLNWRYALLATIAGLAYGWVYQRTRKVSAAALTHGSLNWVWSTWFGR
jgi:membrane protease YdiL (CAAX protease family)